MTDKERKIYRKNYYQKNREHYLEYFANYRKNYKSNSDYMKEQREKQTLLNLMRGVLHPKDVREYIIFNEGDIKYIKNNLTIN